MKSGAKTIAMLTLGILLSTPLIAQIQNNVQIHGFGGWAAGRTDNDNEYGFIAGKETPLANYYLALNFSAQLERNISIFAQPSWQTNLKGDEMVLDYAFAQWTIARQFGLRVGKIKNPVYMYSEVLNVGTLRPFYLVPQGMYVAASQSYTGVGLTGIVGIGALEMSYDLFGGLQSYEQIIIEQPVGFDPIASVPVFQSLHISPEGRNFIGGRLLFQTPVSGFKVGGTLIGIDLYYQLEGGPKLKSGNKRSVGYTGQAEYVTDCIQLRAEYGHLVDPNAAVGRGFAEAAYKITSHWQVAADYDWVKFNYSDIAAQMLPTDKNLGKHGAVGLALNYWVSPDLVFKLNRYWVNGNNLSKPVNAAQSTALGTLQKKTNVWVFGMQFAF